MKHAERETLCVSVLPEHDKTAQALSLLLPLRVPGKAPASAPRTHAHVTERQLVSRGGIFKEGAGARSEEATSSSATRSRVSSPSCAWPALMRLLPGAGSTPLPLI